MKIHNLHKVYLPRLAEKSSSMMTQIKTLTLQTIRGNYTITKNGRRQKDALTRKQEKE